MGSVALGEHRHNHAMRVITLGDMHVDIVLRRDPPPDRGAPTCSRVEVDGRTAVVAAWAASMGGEVDLIGARGDDPVAQMAAADLFTRGVRLRGPVVSGEGEARFATDPLGSDPSDAPPARLTPSDLDPSWFERADVLYVSGHALLTRATSDVAVMAATMARRSGARIVAGLPSSSLMGFVGSRTVSRRIRAIRPAVLFGSQTEFEDLGTRLPAELTVTRHEDGTVVIRGHERSYAVPAPDIAAVDPAGVEDAFIAGFLMGGDVEDSIARAYHAGTMCLGRQGALPPMREAIAPAPVR